MKSSIYIIFVSTLILYLTSGILRFFNIHIENNIHLYNILLVLPILGVLLHTIYTLGIKNTLIFIFLSSGIGFISEYLGVHYGYVFGSGYTYKMSGIYLFNIPIIVLIYWYVFIYTGFIISNLILGKNIFLKSILGAYFVLAIDLFMEPMQIQMGNWVWHKTGIYFGIPLSNFVGWYIVSFVSLLLFQLITKINIKKDKINLIPVYGYILIWVSLLLYMLATDNYTIALIGSIFMLPAIFTL